MKKRFLFMLFFLFFLMGIAWSQTGTVKGTVTSGEDGLPVSVPLPMWMVVSVFRICRLQPLRLSCHL